MATQQEIAEHLDLSTRRVRELIRLGVLPAGKGRGGLEVDRCRFAFIAYLRGLVSGHRSEDGSLDLTAERAKLARAQTEATELKNAEARGSLIPADLVLEHWAGQHATVKAHLRAVPHQLKTEHPEVPVEHVEAVRKLIDQACAHYADGLPRTGGDAKAMQAIA